jgi:hypothetical protein
MFAEEFGKNARMVDGNCMIELAKIRGRTPEAFSFSGM